MIFPERGRNFIEKQDQSIVDMAIEAALKLHEQAQITGSPNLEAAGKAAIRHATFPYIMTEEDIETIFKGSLFIAPDQYEGIIENLPYGSSAEAQECFNRMVLELTVDPELDFPSVDAAVDSRYSNNASYDMAKLVVSGAPNLRLSGQSHNADGSQVA